MLGDDRYIEIVQLKKTYPNPYGDDVTVVEDFNLKIVKGERIGLIGHSGCGKSTVLTMVAGLNTISAGNVVVAGHEIDGPGPDRAVVFQAPCLLPWLTAYQNVMLGVKRCYPHASKSDRHNLVGYYLSRAGLGDAMHKLPRELSGGMQQRVGIARAMALHPKVLLLDEPFGRLDSLTRMQLQDVILELLEREKITTLLVTHDVDEAIYMCDRVVMMTTGPRATVGGILTLPFEQRRVRSQVLEHSAYYELRSELIAFLESQDHRGKKSKTETCDSADEEPTEDDHTMSARQVEDIAA